MRWLAATSATLAVVACGGCGADHGPRRPATTTTEACAQIRSEMKRGNLLPTTPVPAGGCGKVEVTETMVHDCTKEERKSGECIEVGLPAHAAPPRTSRPGG